MKALKVSSDIFANIILWLLLMLPLSFKIEFFSGIILYPQEALLPILIIIQIIVWNFKLKTWNSAVNPYIYLLIALLIVIFSTLLSFYYSIPVEGMLKSIKYLIYIVSIIVISKVITQKKRFYIAKWFNRIAFLTIVSTLLLFILGKIQSGVSWSEYMTQAIWLVEVMPTGFSNLVLNIPNWEFLKYTGNHGIYGSYLMLVYLFNLGLILDRSNLVKRKWSLLLILLSLINIGLLTSRETLLIFFVTNLGFLFLYLLNRKTSMFLKLGVVLSFFLLLAVVVFWGNEITLIQKITYTANAMAEGRIESNFLKRIQVWQLTVNSYAFYPLCFFLGYGFNKERYANILAQVANENGISDMYASVPESYFFTFLAYGGVFALLLSLGFFLSLINIGSKKRSLRTNTGKLLFFFTIGLFISNNTGASVLADLLMSQLGIIFIWFHQVYKYE